MHSAAATLVSFPACHVLPRTKEDSEALSEARSKPKDVMWYIVLSGYTHLTITMINLNL